MDWHAWLTVATIIGIAVALVRDLARPDMIFFKCLGSAFSRWHRESDRSFCGVF